MALRTESYQQVKRRVESMIGQSITEDDKDGFDSLLNDSIRYAYEETPYWPRYLRYEPRTVSRGYIDDEEDSYHVYGAGSSAVNGLYALDEDSGFYIKSDSDGNALFDIRPGTGAEWQIVSVSYVTSDGEFVTSEGNYVYVPGEILYENNTVSATPPELDWSSVSGEDPTPIVQALGKIEEIIWQETGSRWNSTSNSSKLFNYRDSNGIRSTCVEDGQVWVTYKLQLTETYGDGTDGTVSEIPREFSRYAALAVSYELQRSARYVNPNSTYTIAYQMIQDSMDQALLNIDRQGAQRTIKNLRETRYSADNSVR
jgi:hypothetical protein